jgi:hypothetical protein
MKRELTPLVALAASAGPYLPAVAISAGVLALLAWLLSEAESKPSVAPAPHRPHVAEPPPLDADYPRHASGKFASLVTLGDLRAVFASGPVAKADAVAALCKRTGCSRSAAYHVLTKRFSVFLVAGADGRLAFAE